MMYNKENLLELLVEEYSRMTDYKDELLRKSNHNDVSESIIKDMTSYHKARIELLESMIKSEDIARDFNFNTAEKMKDN